MTTPWIAIELYLSSDGAFDVGEVFGPFPDELSALEFQGKMEGTRDFLVVPLKDFKKSGA